MSITHSNISIFVTHLGCPNCCSFCNQHHIAGECCLPDASTVDSAVLLAKKGKNYNPKTTEIAFFGGSFTAIDREYMISLLSAASKYIKDGSVYGIRISTRPDAINDEILTILENYGVTTIELGAQSMDDGVLIKNRRGHTSKQVENASKLIKSYGFSLGLQMMTGLYGSNDELDVFTAEKIIALNPDCVRIYPTITLRDTQLETLYKSGEYTPMSLQDAVKLCVKLCGMFERENIPVIRLGLHTIDEDAYVAGPWHSAFAELCDSYKFRKLIESKLGNKGEYTVFVNPRSLSKAIGQSKTNINYFKKIGYDIKIKEDNDLTINECLVKGC